MGELKGLLETKREYIQYLQDVLVDPFLNEFDRLYEKEAAKQSRVLQKFQEAVANIADWNHVHIREFVERVVAASGCSYMADLVRAIFITSVKAQLLAYKAGNKMDQVKLRVPNVENFLHRCFIACARIVWKQPYLFYHAVRSIERQHNRNMADELFRKAILTTIRNTIPMDQILKQILGEVPKEVSSDPEEISDSESEYETEEESSEEESSSEEETSEETEEDTQENTDEETTEEVEFIDSKESSSDDESEVDEIYEDTDAEDITEESLKNQSEAAYHPVKIELSESIAQSTPAEPVMVLATEPAESATEPVESATEPAESATEPVESATEPAESVAEPVESVAEPVESVAEPVESATEPAEPAEPVESNEEPMPQLHSIIIHDDTEDIPIEDIEALDFNSPSRKVVEFDPVLPKDNTVECMKTNIVVPTNSIEDHPTTMGHKDPNEVKEAVPLKNLLLNRKIHIPRPSTRPRVENAFF